MFRGRQVFKFSLQLGLIWILLQGLHASAAGPYGFGMKWSGGLNPYRLSADITFHPGFTSALGTSSPGEGDGVMVEPTGMGQDSSGNLYVLDRTAHRILKYSSAGAFLGWIGKIRMSPTGGAAGCNGAAPGTVTPGWCTGGLSLYGTGDGMLFYPIDLTVDPSGNILVIDTTNNRIVKFNSSGVYVGWIGKIATSPTGGAAGCNGAAVGTFTPGWCTGGSAGDGSAGTDGLFQAPEGISTDSSGNIYIVDTGNNRISKYNSSGVFQGWLGKIATSPTGGAAGCNGAAVGTATPGWCTGGTPAIAGAGDGMVYYPYDLTVDASGNIFVADTSNSRISKFNSAGVFQGWIGKILTSPTGGAAACIGAAVGTITPSWCTGGTADMGTGDGMFSSVQAVDVDSSGNVYASSISGRLMKFNSAGAFVGWIGKIATSPTGGAAGCNGAAVGTLTPGWCTGGTSATGNGDGMINTTNALFVDSSNNVFVVDSNVRLNKYTTAGVFQGALQSTTNYQAWHRSAKYSANGSGDGMLNEPHGIDLDSAGNLYVVDNRNHRILKYNSAGTFLGWLGSIATTPTGGAAGCNAAAVGTATPGWCTGGTAQWGSDDGETASPHDIALDISGNMYVSDEDNSRVVKYNSAGVFQGWIGRVYQSPTGGAAGCNGKAVGTATPGWCTGGQSQSGSGNGMISYPMGIGVDSSGNIYVSDSGNNRLVKFNSSGVFVGWVGKIGTSPTGGAAGCSGAVSGTLTPGWCTGGTALGGSTNGALSYPNDLTVDSSGNIYVADNGNGRLSKYNSAGVFQGWIGKIYSSPTGGAAGCNGAAVGTTTPGWCTGGEPDYGSVDGEFSGIKAVALDPQGNLYATDWDNTRVSKFNSSGVFQGWIGPIETSPTGGAAGCKGAAANSVTPGWCKGGTSLGQGIPGEFRCPTGIVWSPTGNLFVSDCYYSIIRYNIQGR